MKFLKKINSINQVKQQLELIKNKNPEKYALLKYYQWFGVLPTETNEQDKKSFEDNAKKQGLKKNPSYLVFKEPFWNKFIEDTKNMIQDSKTIPIIDLKKKYKWHLKRLYKQFKTASWMTPEEKEFNQIAQNKILELDLSFIENNILQDIIKSKEDDYKKHFNGIKV